MGKPSSSEILEMSVTTKECLCASILLVLDQTGYLPPPISGSLLYLAIVATFLLVKISSALGEPIDPFAPLERLCSSLALGGLWDQVGWRRSIEVLSKFQKKEKLCRSITVLKLFCNMKFHKAA